MPCNTKEQELFNRLFDFDRNVFGWVPHSAPQGETRTQATWTPRVDIRETEEAFTFHFDLPGLKQEEIDIEYNEDTLTIKGERKQEQETKQEGYVRTERYYGKFQRSFTLKTPVEGERITATYKNGVLEVVLPKAEAVKPKKITVTTE